MPWSHVLPDYARARPYYGQNLVDVAAALQNTAGPSSPLCFVDVGANIGDSALQILHRVDGRGLCVEADPYWASYLRRNLVGESRVVVEQALLTAAAAPGRLAPERRHGTTRFAPAARRAVRTPTLSVQELRLRHRAFDRVRLIKSDTDGFDAELVPALAAEWHDSSPVLFFEFDPILARKLTSEDPHRLWSALGELGYERAIIWDNTGDPLGQTGIDQAAEHARRLEQDPHPGYQFWDVATWRADDAGADAALRDLVRADFDPLDFLR